MISKFNAQLLPNASALPLTEPEVAFIRTTTFSCFNMAPSVVSQISYSQAARLCRALA